VSADGGRVYTNHLRDREFHKFRQRGEEPTLNVTDMEFTQALENNANGQPVYIGKTTPGRGKDEAYWQIQKITYDANNYVTDIQWADGTAEFTKVWDDRDGYTYS